MALLLGLSAIVVPWQTLLLSVLLYIVVPVNLAQVIRRAVLASGGDAGLSRLLAAVQPLSLLALLATLVLLFAFQGPQILAQPLVIALLAVPILIQVYFYAGLAYILNRWTGEAHCVAAPSALIGASNFFELAVAAAIAAMTAKGKRKKRESGEDDQIARAWTAKRADRSLPFESRGIKPCYRRAHAAISAMKSHYTPIPLGFQVSSGIVPSID